jgi:CubicO group peptidase (beta-lactamase class C family)
MMLLRIVRSRLRRFDLHTTVFVLAAIATIALDAAPQSGSLERIRRVEQGLIPRVVPKGDASKTYSIEERMKYHGIPGMSMAVIDAGQVAWVKAYGVRGKGAQERVTPDTLFQAASLSKPVSALGAMLLVQQRRLELDGDLSPYLLPWVPGEAVTLRQLLSHTAGLTVEGFSGYPPGAALPTAIQILNGQPPANNESVRVNTTPGTQVRYSGGGFVAVQHLVMGMSQLPFDEYMRMAVFSPLSMTRSSFEQPLSRDHARTAAFGHRRDGSRLSENGMVHPEMAAAGLWTTPRDLAQMIIELQDASAGRPPRLLEPERAREMLTGRVDNAGLGLFLTGPNGSSRRFTHSGRNAGFDAFFVAYKNGRQGAIIMINRNNNEGFISEVLESVAREYAWPDYIPTVKQQAYEAISSSIQGSYAGSYEGADHRRITVIFEEDKLFARESDREWFRIYPASASEFFATENPGRFIFVSRPNGQVDEMITRSDNGDEHRRRIP